MCSLPSGLIVGALIVWASPADAPIKRHGLIARVLLALVLPAMIHVYFVLHGGQRVAFNRSLTKSASCPFCRNPVKTLLYDRQRAPTTQLAESVFPIAVALPHNRRFCTFWSAKGSCCSQFFVVGTGL